MASGYSTDWIPYIPGNNMNLTTEMNLNELYFEFEKVKCTLNDNLQELQDMMEKCLNGHKVLDSTSLKIVITNCTNYANELKVIRKELNDSFDMYFGDYITSYTDYGLPLPSIDCSYDYFYGDSPWDFTLITKHKNLINEIQNLLIKDSNSLKQADPFIGEKVLCKNRHQFFRAVNIQLIEDSDAKTRIYKVYDIDKGLFHKIPSENVFVIPEYLEKYQPLSIRCTLVREPMVNGSWTPSLRNYFVEVLKENKQYIIIKDKIQLKLPPQYLIELTDENLETSVINQWFTTYVLPAIEYTAHEMHLIEDEVIEADLSITDLLVEDNERHITKITYEINEITALIVDKLKNVHEVINRLQDIIKHKEVHTMFLYRFRKNVHLFSCAIGICNNIIEHFYTNNFENFVNNVRLSLFRVINPEEEVAYKFLKGDNPWDFVIRREDNDLFLKLKHYYTWMIKTKQKKRMFEFPKYSNIYLCISGYGLYRGFCFGLTSDLRVKMYDVDSGLFEIVARKHVFELPDELKNFPPSAVRCSLLKNSFGINKWTIELNEEFKEVLSEHKIFIKIIGQIGITTPPKYYVNLALQDSSGCKSNYSEWLQNFILPISFKKKNKTILKEIELEPVVKNDEGVEGDNLVIINGKLPTYDDIIDEYHFYNEEVKFCKFYSKCGYCWKNDCTRVHMKNSAPGFIGSLYTYSNLKNQRKVFPKKGDVISLRPVHIINPTAFYAHLYETRDDVSLTLEMLEQRMNNFAEKQRYGLLETIPCIGELVLAPLPSKNKWGRARVIEVDDIKIKLFFVDYGFKVWEAFRELRKINFDFLFLSAQAVRCTLSPNLKRGSVRSTTEIKDLDKVYGTVLSSNQNDCELELIIYKQKGLLILTDVPS